MKLHKGARRKNRATQLTGDQMGKGAGAWLLRPHLGTSPGFYRILATCNAYSCLPSFPTYVQPPAHIP